MVAIIDSPDLAQAYADNEKAGDAFNLNHKNLERQEAQNKLGVASEIAYLASVTCRSPDEAHIRALCSKALPAATWRCGVLAAPILTAQDALS